MKSFLDEFKKFALRGNAVDLAVGIVIGAAFTAVTNSLVTDILSPPIGWLIGGIDFSELGIRLDNEVIISYGLFLQALVNFVITAFALFLLLRLINKLVQRARKEQEEGKASSETKSPELMVLEEIRDSLKEN